jgi:carboxymethylenebutenolidase
MQRLAFTLHDELVSEDLRAVHGYLTREVNATKKIGVTGFCLGGRLTFLAACRNHEFDAYVGFYGHPIAAPPHGISIISQLGTMKGPLLGIFGLRDRYIPSEDVARFETELKRANVNAQIITYDAEHGFMKQGYYDPDYYDPVAASDAWKRTMQFLRRHLS